MRRGLAFAVFLVLLADAVVAAAASPAFGRQRRRAPAVSAEPELPPAPVLPPAPEVRVRSVPGPDARLFPRPPAIEDRVRFWTRVYSEVETNEGFVHDNRDLGVVYDVVRWPKGLPESEASRHYEGSKKRYAALLRRLAREPHTGLTAEEQRVLALFPKGVSRARLEEASEGVRFQRGQADKFRDGVIRSGQWEAYIRQVFRERGLPLELALLPHVESSFNPLAYSKVGAAGLWQFMPSTGRLFKLRVDRTVDERFDPWRATEAAAALLANNHRVTGTWPLALIAYNHGPGGSIRAKKELGTDDIGVILGRYDGPSFGFASRNFYPSFLAAVEVDRNHVRYFGEIRKMAPARHEAVVTDGTYSARALSQSFGMDLGLLREWNLGLREPVWRGQQLVPKGVTLRFPPVAGRAPAAQILAAIPQERRPSQISGRTYIVKRGDTLSSIARRYGMSTRALASANGIRKPSAIHVGRRLRLPGTVEREIVADAAERRPPRAQPAAAPAQHEVRRGETLASIARRYGTSAHALASANGIQDPDEVRVGQPLTIPGAARVAGTDAPPAATRPRARTYTVRHGDTVSSIARRYGVSVKDLQAANNLSRSSYIRAGQKLRVPVDGG
ncbi:MAG: LysM peptidoglycan-binding domain-containing protein [Deltaproteobacteria bacterium]|nr:LysM peptidoglycan-binding domain-containing protein [Deltaproteobacteria bacterium]